MEDGKTPQYNFDLHCHPTSKSFLTRSQKTPWDTIRGGVLQPIAPILESQSNFSQLFEGNVKLAVLPVVPIELGFSSFWMLRDVVGALLVLDRDFIKEINSGVHSYNKLFWEEIKHLTENLEHNGRKVKLVRWNDDIKNEADTLYAIPAIEGSHFLFTRHDQECDIMGNLSKAKKVKDFSFLYMTLTHLTWNSICNHAYGAKFIDADVKFPNPDTKGISQLGFKIIDTCYSTDVGKRILIDLKHMSLYARMEFYNTYFKDNSKNVPILATHVGLTGYSYRKIPDVVKKTKKHGSYIEVFYERIRGAALDSEKDAVRSKTFFKPWSINLYDEEIRMIVASDGLIGIMMDQKMLGQGKHDSEYFREDEYKAIIKGDIFIKSQVANYVDNKGLDVDDKAVEEVEDSNQKINERKHLRYLCNTLLHVFKVGANFKPDEASWEKGKKAWKHVCIGSDFDGLIDPINTCKSSADFPDLEERLPGELQDLMDRDAYAYPAIDLKAFARDFMYNNARAFIEKHFKKDVISPA